MGFGSITHYIDYAQVALYAFWIFFAGLVYYLRREDKREGYPLISDRSANVTVQGFPSMPAPKVFLLRNGTTYEAPPGRREERAVDLAPASGAPGAPALPQGNPLLDGVGPASWAEREELPELTAEDEHRVVPLRVATDYAVAAEDADPRGMAVIGADDVIAGDVVDLWIDRSEPQIRYLEVALAGQPQLHVLLPAAFARIDGRRRRILVRTLLAEQFAHVPRTASPDLITAREEDRVTAFFGGGQLYALPDRQEPAL